MVQVGPSVGPVAQGNDTASLRLPHHRQPRLLAAQKRPQGVDLELPANIAGRDVLQSLALPDGGTVHEDVRAGQSDPGPAAPAAGFHSRPSGSLPGPAPRRHGPGRQSRGLGLTDRGAIMNHQE